MTILYHYTSLQGLIGIITNGAVWCSHCEYLNDSSEFKHALDFAKNMSTQIFMEDDYLAAIGYTLRDSLEGMMKHNVFVTSFSEKSDLLSQWRGYCPQSSGISLGFDKELLHQYCVEHGFRLEKCLYDNELKISLISQLTQEAIKMFPPQRISKKEYDELSSYEQCEFVVSSQMDIDKKENKLNLETTLNNLHKQLNLNAPLLKHYGFHEEREWRIIVSNPDVSEHEVSYRPSNSHVIPYLILPIINKYPEVLREIYIGPSPEPYRCKSSIQYLLNERKLDRVQIKVSKLPFTSW